MGDRRFRVLRGQSRLPQAERDLWPESIPWALVEQWREQAERNHGQTLEQLHDRGGLAPEELWIAAHRLRLRGLNQITESDAGKWLIAIAATSDPGHSIAPKEENVNPQHQPVSPGIQIPATIDREIRPGLHATESVVIAIQPSDLERALAQHGFALVKNPQHQDEAHER